jgi:ParB/RepB/Spo0J family partition protein
MKIPADSMDNREKKNTVPSLVEDIIDIPLEELSLKYERFRLARPKANSTVEMSIKHYGQLTPIVVNKSDSKHRYEIIDGFKRFHSAKKLMLKHLQGRALNLNAHALKAAMVQLNYAYGSIGPFEEGMILNSLHREDGLRQNEIAVLFGRHKSWVCRRIALVEHLCEEVIEYLRLGLIGMGIGRELAQLPRGNQGEAIKTVLKHHFCCRETHQLVNMLMTRPRWEHENILRFPISILEARTPPRPKISGETETLPMIFNSGIDLIRKGCKHIEDDINKPDCAIISDLQQTNLLNSIDIAENQFNRIRAIIKGPIHAATVY